MTDICDPRWDEVINAHADWSAEHLSCITTVKMTGGCATWEQIAGQRQLRQKWPAWPQARVRSRALQQASSQATAIAKWRHFSAVDAAQSGRAIDLTGGLGIDSWAAAQHGYAVHYNDRDADLVALWQANSARYGLTSTTSCDDALTLIKRQQLGSDDAICCDPDRRENDGGKLHRPNAWSPPLDAVLAAIGDQPAMIKCGTGISLDHLPAAGHTVILGWRGECREVVCYPNQSGPLTVDLLADDGSSLWSLRQGDHPPAPWADP